VFYKYLQYLFTAKDDLFENVGRTTVLSFEMFTSGLRSWLKNVARFNSLERFSIAFTANGKRQAEISRLPKTREIYLGSVYILPVSHSYGASTKNREIS